MVQRVNTRFVIILVSVIGLLVGGAVGGWYFFLRDSCEQLAARGGEHETAGRSHQAFLLFGRALRKCPDNENYKEAVVRNLKLIAEQEPDKFVESLHRANATWPQWQELDDMIFRITAAARTDSDDTAIQLGGIAEQVSSEQANTDPGDVIADAGEQPAGDGDEPGGEVVGTEARMLDAQPLERYFLLQYERARVIDARQLWHTLRQKADERVQLDQSSGRSAAVARKWRGVAGARLLPTMSLDSEREAVVKDLEAAIDADPSAPVALHHLARAKLALARQLKAADEVANEDRIDTLQREALNTSTHAAKANPLDPDAQLSHARVLLSPPFEDREQATKIVKRAADQLAKAPESTYLIEQASRLLPSLLDEPIEGDPHGRTEGQLEAEQLLDAALGDNPDQASPVLHMAMGALMAQQRRYEAALAAYTHVADQPTGGRPLEAYRYQITRRQAVLRAAETAIDWARAADDEKTREARLAQAEAYANRLQIEVGAGHEGDVPQVALLRGRIALTRGNRPLALARVDEASRGFRDANVQALLLSADLRQQLGSPQAAATRYRQAIDLLKRSGTGVVHAPAYLALAETQMRAGQLDDAALVLEELRTDLGDRAADNDRLHYAVAQLAARRGRADEAFAAVEQIDLDAMPAALALKAALLAERDQKDEAKAMLTQRLEQDPKDPMALQLLVKLAEDDDERSAVIARAADAGAEPLLIEQLQRAAGDQDPITLDEAVALIEQQDRPEIEKLLNLAAVRVSAGQHDEALEHIKAVLKADPENERALKLGFAAYLATDQLDDAARLSKVAGRINLDGAEGKLFESELAAARGDIDRAITLSEQALEDQPINAAAQARLGAWYVSEGRYRDAATRFRRAVEQNARNRQAWVGLAETESRLGRGSEALASIKRAVALNPNNLDLVRLAIDFEQRYGDADTALRQRQALAEAVPDDLNNRRQLALLLAPEDAAAARAIAAELIASEGEDLRNVYLAAEVERLAGNGEAGLARLRGYVEGLEEPGLQDLSTLAQMQATLGKVDEATATYRRALRYEDPEKREVSRALADMLFNARRLDQALSYYRNLSEGAPGDVTLAQRLAETYLRLDQPEDAERVLKAHADNPTTLLLLALGAAASDRDRAIGYLDQAIAIDPDDEMLYVQRANLRTADAVGLTAAVDDLRRAIELRPGFAAARRQLARVYAAQGRNDEAIEQFEQMLDADPDEVEARWELVQLQLRLGRLLEADRWAEGGGERFDQQGRWPAARARIAAQRGADRDALRLWELAAAREPTAEYIAGYVGALLDADDGRRALAVVESDPEPLERSILLQAQRGRAMAAIGRTSEAEQVFLATLRKAQNGPQVLAIAAQMGAALPTGEAVRILDESGIKAADWTLIAGAQLLLGAGQHQAVIDLLADATLTAEAGSPVWLRAKRMLALAYYQAEQHGPAEQAYRALLEHQPDDLEALNNLAYMLAEAVGDPEAALPLANRAAGLAPRDAQVLDTYGWVRHLVGDHRGARETLEQSVAIRELPPNLLHLGIVLKAQDELVDAETRLVAAIEAADAAGDEATAAEARRVLAEVRATLEEATP